MTRAGTAGSVQPKYKGMFSGMAMIAREEGIRVRAISAINFTRLDVIDCMKKTPSVGKLLIFHPAPPYSRVFGKGIWQQSIFISRTEGFNFWSINKQNYFCPELRTLPLKKQSLGVWQHLPPQRYQAKF